MNLSHFCLTERCRYQQYKICIKFNRIFRRTLIIWAFRTWKALSNPFYFFLNTNTCNVTQYWFKFLEHRLFCIHYILYFFLSFVRVMSVSIKHQGVCHWIHENHATNIWTVTTQFSFYFTLDNKYTFALWYILCGIIYYHSKKILNQENCWKSGAFQLYHRKRHIFQLQTVFHLVIITRGFTLFGLVLCKLCRLKISERKFFKKKIKIFVKNNLKLRKYYWKKLNFCENSNEKYLKIIIVNWNLWKLTFFGLKLIEILQLTLD